MRAQVAALERADIIVGIPSFNNAATVGHVARSAAEGLRRSFPQARAAIVNADGGSRDGTSERVRESVDGMPAISGRYLGLPGKGSAFRAIFEAADRLGARACAVVDSDLRSISPEWIERLLRPVWEGAADYVVPLYARHKHDGTITNTIAYPLTRALYGVRVRQPIGGEFGFSGALAERFLRGGAFTAREGGRRPAAPADGDFVWETDVARFGIDVYMTTTALVAGARVVQAFLGAKIHDPKDPGADLAPMFIQVVGTAFRLSHANQGAWWDVRGSRPAPVSGEVSSVEPEPVNADLDRLRRNYTAGAAEFGDLWRDVLGREEAQRGERAWARTVYDFLAAARRNPERTGTVVRALVPLYFARVADFIEDAAEMDTRGSERLVEAQAEAFEAEKPYLRDRWEAA